MKNGDKSSELAACLFFKRLSLLKTSLAVRGINAIEDATLLDLCKKYLKFYIWFTNILSQSAPLIF